MKIIATNTSLSFAEKTVYTKSEIKDLESAKAKIIDGLQLNEGQVVQIMIESVDGTITSDIPTYGFFWDSSDTWVTTNRWKAGTGIALNTWYTYSVGSQGVSALGFGSISDSTLVGKEIKMTVKSFSPLE